MDRRITLVLIGIVVVALLATGGWVAYNQFNKGSANTAGGALNRYTNAAFGYTLEYPAAWGLNVANQETYMNVYVRLDQGPGLPGFEITCADNPTRLTAQQWWRAHVSPFLNEAPIGDVTLTSGTHAYKNSGEGSQSFELYTIVHADKVCQLTNDKHGRPQVTQQADAAINSFTWN